MDSLTSFSTPFFLIANGFLLALAIAFLLIILWYDLRRAVYQFFALFLVTVAVWNVGYLIQQAATLTSADSKLVLVAQGIISIGFAGSSASLYALCAVLVGTRLQWFRTIAGLAIFTTLALNTFVLFSQLAYGQAGMPSFNWSPLFYLVFDGATLYIVWRYQRMLQNDTLVAGIVLFVVGQGSVFLNQQLGLSGGGLLISSFGCLIMSGSFIRRELIMPLVSRNQQLVSMHEVSLAITTRIASTTLMSEIAERARHWLQGEAAAIYLQSNGNLRLEAVHNMPLVLLHSTANESSFATHIASTRHSFLIENYGQQWHTSDHLTVLADAFGSVIGTPLLYDDQVIGVLLVIASRQSRTFTQQDLTLLELLGSQASVALAHDQLFGNREILATQIQIANDQLQTVLASTKSPVLALDRNLVVVFSNSAASELMETLSLNSSALIMSDSLRPLLPPSALETIRDIRRQGVHIYELRIQGKTYQCRLGAWGSPHIEGWVAVLHDVSELKELDRIKSEMVRMTSHDLKNPLQAALANLDLLRDDVNSLDTDHQEMRLSVNNVEKQLNKMQRIISGILDLERVRLSAHVSEVCDPHELVRLVYEELNDIACEKQVRLQVAVTDPIASFIGDHTQLERALVNLVDNAIKFSPAQGEVSVTAEQKGSMVEFCVRDSGVGVSPELHEKIFERFYRGRQSGIEHISGTGLGLSLVKAVAENHGGKVWVESESGQGAAFFLHFTAITESVQILR